MSDPMSDPMDARLRAAAHRWQAQQPPPPGLPEQLPDRPPATRRWLPAAVAAAVLVGAVVLASALLPRDAQPSPAAPSPTPSPGPTAALPAVPWLDLPATHPQVRTRVPGPPPASADGAPACTVDDVRATRQVGGALGTTYVSIRLELTGDVPCALDGVPDVTARTSDGTTVPGRAQVDDSTYGRAVLVSGDASALLSVGWPSGCAVGAAPGATLSVSLPGGRLTLGGLALGSTCELGGPVRTLRSVSVEPFAPVNAPSVVVTPYDAIGAEADLDLSARPGSTLTFTVYLTALDATSLDPCPDYTVWIGAAGGVRRSLNCAAVPYVDASGVPYLPAGVPVAFEMRLTVPDLRGEQKILWVLDGPQSMPGTHGVLTIQP